jgi:hypothetical protein
MAAGVDLFERRNRLRIVALVVLATVNDIVAVIMASIALGLTLAIAILVEGDVGTDADSVLIFLVGVGIVAGVSIVIGILVGLGRIPPASSSSTSASTTCASSPTSRSGRPAAGPCPAGPADLPMRPAPSGRPRVSSSSSHH